MGRGDNLLMRGRAMPGQAAGDDVKEKFDEAKYQFISLELDLAFTFCQIAQTTGKRATADRNRMNARTAYDAAKHFLEDSNFTPEECAEIHSRMSALRALLLTPERRPPRKRA